jgi:DNA-binding MarR family transcriptional regulator
MSNQAEFPSSRARVLAELVLATNAHSEAALLFHASIAHRMGLDPTAYKTLFVLRRLGPLSAGEISRETGLATASVTDLIDRLMSKGYVRRSAHPQDRRRIIITLNEEALTAARRQFGVPNPSLTELANKYDVRDLEMIADFLKSNANRLREELAQLDGQTPLT